MSIESELEQQISSISFSMTVCDGVRMIRDFPNGDMGEQTRFESVSQMRLEDEDGDEADGFFYVDGPDLASVPVSDKMKPCMQRVKYGDETMRSFLHREESARHQFPNSNEGKMTLNSRMIAGINEETCHLLEKMWC
jgi:hypothetical protein